MNRSERRPTVLVVDDETDVADVYAEHLLGTYAVRTAYSGSGALEAMSSDVDVVLLDRRMPDKSGDEVLALIRDRDYDCRVVFLTAVNPAPEVLSLDFDGYLTKPVSGDDLREIVATMLARREYVATLEEAVALASKMATLETKMDIEELKASEEYREVQDRFDELRGEIGAPPDEGLYSELARQKLATLFE